jgi:hypothetical protein
MALVRRGVDGFPVGRPATPYVRDLEKRLRMAVDVQDALSETVSTGPVPDFVAIYEAAKE